MAASNRKNGQREDSLLTWELTGQGQGEMLPMDAGHPSPPTAEQDAPSVQPHVHARGWDLAVP